MIVISCVELVLVELYQLFSVFTTIPAGSRTVCCFFSNVCWFHTRCFRGMGAKGRGFVFLYIPGSRIPLFPGGIWWALNLYSISPQFTSSYGMYYQYVLASCGKPGNCSVCYLSPFPFPFQEFVENLERAVQMWLASMLGFTARKPWNGWASPAMAETHGDLIYVHINITSLTISNYQISTMCSFIDD